MNRPAASAPAQTSAPDGCAPPTIGAAQLAAALGISPRQLRRRVAALALPAPSSPQPAAWRVAELVFALPVDDLARVLASAPLAPAARRSVLAEIARRAESQAAVYVEALKTVSNLSGELNAPGISPTALAACFAVVGDAPAKAGQFMSTLAEIRISAAETRAKLPDVREATAKKTERRSCRRTPETPRPSSKSSPRATKSRRCGMPKSMRSASAG